MKKIFTILATLAALVCFSNAAKAGIPVIYGNGVEIATLHTLPDSVTLSTFDEDLDDVHVDLGVSFKEFHIFWIPMWTYGDVQYALIDNQNDVYYDISQEFAEEIGPEFGIQIAGPARIPFWHRIGGKLIWGALIVAAAWGAFKGKDDQDEAVTGSEPAEE